MTAVWSVARAELRKRWPGVLLFALLVGMAAGLVLSTAAGARRTASSLDRFTAESRTSDLEITVGDATQQQIDRLRHRPGVRAVAPLYQMTLTRTGIDLLPIAAATDGRFGHVVDRARVIHGRHANPSAVNEIEVGEALAHQLHLRLGDRIRFRSFSPEQIERFRRGEDAGDPAGPTVRLRVVGIVRRPLDLGVRGAEGGVLVPTPAFYRAHRADIGSFGGTILRIRAVQGARDIPTVVREARRIFGDSEEFDVQGLGIDTEGASDAIDALALSLWLFAGFAAMAGVVALATVATRQTSLVRPHQRTLLGLGLTRAQRTAAAAVVLLPGALVGTIVALVAAAAASLLFPFGLARLAEPDAGFAVDPMVLGLGALGVLVVVLSIVAFASWRVASSAAEIDAAARRPSAVARAAGTIGLGPASTTGIRMALEPGRGAKAVPVRSALGGAVFGVLGVVAVLVLGASLDRLVTTPGRFGWTWDVALPRTAEDPTGLTACGPRRSPLADDLDVRAVAVACVSNVRIGQIPVPAVAFRQLEGRIKPTVVDGRAPVARDEIALGSTTLGAVGKSIGDEVSVAGPRGTRRFRIVGQVALPTFEDPQALADGAVLSAPGIRRLLPRRTEALEYWTLVRLGSDRPAHPQSRDLARGPARVLRPQVPLEIDRLRELDQLPEILGAFLALLGSIALTHALVTGVRRRRRDLAVLRTMGLSARQLWATIGWQAGTIAATGLIIGIPAGVLVGRTAWRAIAESLGVSPDSEIPWLVIAVLTLGTFVLTAIVTIVPGRRASRTHPAIVLRAE